MALAVVILVGVFVGLHKYEQSRYHTNRGETSEYFYEDTRIEVDGVFRCRAARNSRWEPPAAR